MLLFGRINAVVDDVEMGLSELGPATPSTAKVGDSSTAEVDVWFVGELGRPAVGSDKVVRSGPSGEVGNSD